jgi:hypothetical protein
LSLQGFRLFLQTTLSLVQTLAILGKTFLLLADQLLLSRLRKTFALLALLLLLPLLLCSFLLLSVQLLLPVFQTLNHPYCSFKI